MNRHVIQFSGGIGSFAAALRVAERHGTANMTLLIADTRAEHPDTWRFADDTSRLLDVPLTVVRDGRDPWQVFRDVRFLGNDRLAPCTRVLKQIPCRKWMTEHTDPEDTLVYIGIEATARDRARIPAIARNWRPWTTRFPLCGRWERPRTKTELLREAEAHGIQPPAMYRAGFAHNNCHGSCVRAGQKQWKHLLDVAPQQFAKAERHEEELRALLGPVTILRERRKGVARPLPLAELRRRQHAAPALPLPEAGA
ncbi:hypothetical protein ABZ649_04790 [Streptomyces albidoflavus]|uniref:hypothetical protein n=1 Tax=Streptomyces albidoflavus TaxID=1886 RepID=UPI0033C5F8D0